MMEGMFASRGCSFVLTYTDTYAVISLMPDTLAWPGD